ncbi:MAG: serine/threonine protein phosphatase [Firmicutes bacterium]|jgi:predicted phosphohydrolase|nr:serine/threonine protein phosphatase [Bacillota bacterium]
MEVFALADLHLSLQTNKPMDIFGDLWHDHANKIALNWKSVVREEDIVLIPGDISWAMRLSEASLDFAFLCSLPGLKILGRGNHDYYWQSHRKMVQVLPENIIPIDRRVFVHEDFVVASTKGWLCPGASTYKESEDKKYYDLEAHRLNLVLEKAKVHDKKIIVMLHFPPFNEKKEESKFTQLMEEYGVEICVFGHIHGAEPNSTYDGLYGGIEMHLVSADYLNFQPKKLKL